jgi:hypothetical protein
MHITTYAYEYAYAYVDSSSGPTMGMAVRYRRTEFGSGCGGSGGRWVVVINLRYGGHTFSTY